MAGSDLSDEQAQTWDSAYVSYTNSQGISLILDDSAAIILDSEDAYLVSKNELMLSKDVVRDVFDCAVNLYDETTLYVSLGSRQVITQTGSLSAAVIENEDAESSTRDIELAYAVTISDDGTVYIPSQLLTEGFYFSFTWNVEQSLAKFVSEDPDVELISYYNSMADSNKLESVRSQGDLEACWAFAALAALEGTLYPEEIWDFSEDHMLYNNSSGRSISDGGDYLMAVAYLVSWQGPVKEEDDPYNDGETDGTLSAVKHVQEVIFLEDKDIETIKQMVFKYGAVETSVYIATENDSYVSPDYYDYETYSYCYDGSEGANHEIVIIGWDDDYPKENFGGRAESDGAFICKNSWGSDFGDEGLFYVSYEDAVIGTTAEVYTSIEPADNYDNIYQYDIAGIAGTVGYGRNTVYMANVFTAEGDETLEAVGFYAMGAETGYKVYICENYTGTEDLDVTGEVLAEGTFDEAGYYTVDLKEKINLSESQKFAVIVEIDTAGTGKPVAVDTNTADSPEDVSEESYISNYGTEWENTQNSNGCTVCLKAYTSEK